MFKVPRLTFGCGIINKKLIDTKSQNKSWGRGEVVKVESEK